MIWFHYSIRQDHLMNIHKLTDFILGPLPKLTSRTEEIHKLSLLIIRSHLFWGSHLRGCEKSPGLVFEPLPLPPLPPPTRSDDAVLRTVPEESDAGRQARLGKQHLHF